MSVSSKNPASYFLYARKSTDTEDKQVRSIEDQLAVLRALAKTEGLNIVREFEERQLAKMPGRPVFNEMLERIEKGEAQAAKRAERLKYNRLPLRQPEIPGGKLNYLQNWSSLVKDVRTSIAELKGDFYLPKFAT